MLAALLLLLVAAAAQPAAPAPAGDTPTAASITVEARIEAHALTIRAQLEDPLPDWLVVDREARLPVTVEYAIRLRARRKAWWDRRLWRGDLVTRAVFDPVTGRYRCEAVLDGAIVASDDLASSRAAREWLARPPEIRVVLPEDRDPATLTVRARAVFSTSTVWLVFPKTEGTEWAEQAPAPAPQAQEAGTGRDG